MVSQSFCYHYCFPHLAGKTDYENYIFKPSIIFLTCDCLFREDNLRSDWKRNFTLREIGHSSRFSAIPLFFLQRFIAWIAFNLSGKSILKYNFGTSICFNSSKEYGICSVKKKFRRQSWFYLKDGADKSLHVRLKAEFLPKRISSSNLYFSNRIDRKRQDCNFGGLCVAMSIKFSKLHSLVQN